MDLDAAITLFLGEHKPTTAHAYTRPLRYMQQWIGPARELSDIRPEHLVEYAQKRIYANLAFSPATRQKHIKTIKVFFNWALRLELLDRSPAKAVRGKKLTKAIDRDKAMTDEELTAMLDAVRYKPRDYALLLFLADTGARRGGAAGLRLKDVNWEESTARVTEKGDIERQVLFGAACSRAMVAWLAQRKKLRVRDGEDVYLWSHDGRPIQPEAISLTIRRAAKAAGVRVLSPHSLRHRKGHQFADARIAPSIAATALGHSDPMITLNYYYPHDWESAKKALAELALDASAEPPKSSKVISFG